MEKNKKKKIRTVLKLRKPLEKHKMILEKISGNMGKGKRAFVKSVAKELGYSESYADSGLLQKTQSWQNLMEEQLPDELLANVHKGLLKHKEWRARDSGLDKAYKIKRRYNNDLTIEHKFGEFTDKDLEGEIAGILSEALGLTKRKEKKARK